MHNACIPAFLPIANNSIACFDLLRAFANACSRPPPPMMRMRISVMEEANAVGDHNHAVRIARLDNLVVPERPPALHDVGDTALESTIDIVPEREEGIAGKTYVVHFRKESPLYILMQRLYFPAQKSLALLHL